MDHPLFCPFSKKVPPHGDVPQAPEWSCEARWEGLLIALLAIVLVGGPRGSWAQAESDTSNYTDAVLVTASGDSVSGTLAPWNRSQTPQTVHFRLESASGTTRYGPTDLRTVETTEGRRLVSRAVQVYQVPTDPKKAGAYLRSNQRLMRPDTLLMEVVVDGPLRLYTKQGDRNRYFLETDTDIVELIQPRWRDTRNGEEVLATSDRYRRQLKNRMEGCPEVQEKANGVKKTLKALRKIVLEYNRCVTGKSGGQPVAAEKGYWSQLVTSYSLQARSSWNYIPSRTDHFENGYALGATVRFHKAQSDATWSVLLGLRGGRETVGYGVPGARESVGSRKGSIDQTYVGTDALFRYRLPIGAVAPYAEAGISSAWSLQSDVPQIGYLEGVRSGTGFRDGFRDVLELGYTVGAGVIVEPIAIGARRRARTSVLAELIVVSYEVVVGYRF